MIIVPQRWQTALTAISEYGMGYHRVTVTLESGAQERGVIVNAEVFINDVERMTHEMLDSWAEVLREAEEGRHRIVNVQVIPRSVASLKGVRRITANAKLGSLTESLKSESGEAKDAPASLSLEGEIFKRFSAFKNDRRVTAGKGLTAGTFATTKEDASVHIKTGTDAVKRYALENKTPASNVFTIKPPKETNLQRGIVAPAYGETGGGVEVIFVNGSPDGTVTGPDVIPDK